MSAPTIEGLSYRQLDYWTVRGYLHPAVPRPGCGVPRRWDDDELEVARRMARLVSVGFEPAAAERVARLGVGCHELGPDLFVEVGP